MSAVKKLLRTCIQKQEIEEYLREELKDAIFGGVDIAFTPIGTRITIYAMRPGRVIGSRGRVIKEITSALESRFGVENPQVTVAEVEVPELNPYVMAQRIASAIERGARYRRVAFWALRRIMDAGARGVEIEISGKLTSARARSEKYSEGIMPKSGEPAEKYVKRGAASVLLKTGLYGIKVSIYPPDAPLPEEVKLLQPAQAKEPGGGNDQGA
ncbi:MAG: 30S ribosomal protein S3 [Candidatus Terraquivivens tikiterensis]|uniref:Small ribosomal subunit protein uS3 n=1 Tax=Candidatus Terraquivivens tikiterensis TaxID=1980982 RepID=A0A2R7Y716_9ARCH|nr:MAG: 30S ribosomal protein S3 [Candidatus Terraquivivens tikiterensis]